MREQQRLHVFAFIAVAGVAPAAAEPPVPVSPGTLSGITRIDDRCPTFNWAAVPGALSHELAVYAVPETEGTEPDVVVEVKLPGSTGGWTPAMENCLERGGRYAWAVRALVGQNPGPWSRPSLFEVAPGPSEEEFRAALETVRTYLAGSGSTALADGQTAAGPERAEIGGGGRPGADRQSAAGRTPGPLGSTTPDVIGIRSEVPDVTGVTVGLQGISHSTDAGSAGVVGQSTAASGATTGVYGQVASLSGAAGQFENLTAGTVLRGLRNGTELFRVNGTGDVYLGGFSDTDVDSIFFDWGSNESLSWVDSESRFELSDAFAVDGPVDAVSFSGDGSALTSLDPANLSVAVAVAQGGTGATDEAGARTNLGVAAGPHTINTTCNGRACDGTHFTNVQWGNLANRPPGLDDGDDDTTYAAGPGLTLTGRTFSLAPEQVPMDNVASTVDDSARVGSHTSIILGADGRPVVSYYDETNRSLKVAKCNDHACAARAIFSTVDNSLSVGEYTSITLGADGLPVVSYYDRSNNALKVAKCNDPACMGGDESLSTVDNGGGEYTSITLSADGLPVVSYYDNSNNALKVAKCNDPACAGGDETLSTVDNNGGDHTSITLGADGLPVVSYIGRVVNSRDPADITLALKVAKCNDPACAGGDETLVTVDNSGWVGEYTSITLGADGLPVVSYYDTTNSALKFAKCGDPVCGNATGGSVVVDNSGSVGAYTSITLGADGLPVVSYYDETDTALKVAKCNDPVCFNATVWTVDNSGSVGAYTSITLGTDGLPVVSYYDETETALKVAHCGSAFCVPYLRRR